MIVVARVDDRLIHGQVTVGWSRFLSLEKIVVVSDELAGDEMQRSFLAMAVPETTDFDLDSVAGVAAKLGDPAYSAKRTMLLAATPGEFRRLVIEQGVKLEEINLGGQRYADGRHRICDGVLLSDEALADVAALLAAGVRVEVRTIPTNEKKAFADLYAVPR